MNVYISGISGLVGSELRRSLSEEGYVVTGTDIRNPGGLPGIDLADITEFSSFDSIFDRNNVETVIHTAGRPAIYWAEQNPQLAFRLHALGTLNILEGVRHAKLKPKLIYLSSAEVYRLPNKDAEEAVPEPANFYGLSKLTGENYVRMYGERFGFPYTILRPSAVYGTASVKGVPYDLTHPFTSREEVVKLYTSLGSTIDYVYISDVTRAVRMAFGSEWDGVTANIASGDPLRVGAAYEWVCEFMGVNIPLDLTPEAVDIAERTVTNGLALRLDWHPMYGWKDGFAELLKR